jgi:hypothetical protein
MKRFFIIIGAVMLISSMAFAAGPRTYQVTGPILEVKDDSITVQKDKEKWEIARDKDTKVTGVPKVGSKVTIQYTMKAATIEVKEEAKKTEPKKAEPAAKPAPAAK